MRKLVLSLLMTASVACFAQASAPSSYLVTAMPLLRQDKLCGNLIPARELQTLQTVANAARVNPLMIGFEADDDTLVATLKGPTPQWYALAQQEYTAASRASAVAVNRYMYEGAKSVCNQDFVNTAVNYARRLTDAGVTANAQRMVYLMRENRCVALRQCGVPSKRSN